MLNLSPALLLIALLMAHFYFDYAGQGDFMSKAKNLRTEIPGVPALQILFAHGFIHGGAVALITGVWWLGALELFIHMHTDDAKCAGKISYNADQAIHIVCKFVWWLVAVRFVS